MVRGYVPRTALARQSLGAGQAVQDAITAAFAWADPNNPEREETNAEWLAHMFEAEVCAECGWDADKHDVALDPFGNRHAFCKDPVPEDLTDKEITEELARRTAISTSRGEPAATEQPPAGQEPFTPDEIRAERAEAEWLSRDPNACVMPGHGARRRVGCHCTKEERTSAKTGG